MPDLDAMDNHGITVRQHIGSASVGRRLSSTALLSKMRAAELQTFVLTWCATVRCKLCIGLQSVATRCVAIVRDPAASLLSWSLGATDSVSHLVEDCDHSETFSSMKSVN
jgi:hypothetical protein